MNKREAKKRVCNACAHILIASADGAGEWLHTDLSGDELSPADAERMDEAFDEFITELLRRAQ